MHRSAATADRARTASPVHLPHPTRPHLAHPGEPIRYEQRSSDLKSKEHSEGCRERVPCGDRYRIDFRGGFWAAPHSSLERAVESPTADRSAIGRTHRSLGCPCARRERLVVGDRRSAATGVHCQVHEDREHRRAPSTSRAVAPRTTAEPQRAVAPRTTAPEESAARWRGLGSLPARRERSAAGGRQRAVAARDER